MAETLAQHAARRDAESAESDAYVEWCEVHDLDPGDDHWESFRVEAKAAHDDYLESLAESRASGW